MEKLKIEYIPIENIRPNEYNPKGMTEKEAKDLEKSITEFDIVDPIIANKAEGREGKIIGGHQRFKIYKKMGIEEIPVIFLNIPDLEKERELCLRLSKNVGSWDWDLLANFDEEQLIEVGFGEEELEARFNITGEPEEDEYDIEKTIEMIKEPRTKPGELWKLGDHRLYCGDSEKKEDVRKLMDGYQADCVFTDPPYNVNYAGMKHDKIKNDNMTETAFVEFTLKYMEILKDNLKTGGVFYICSGWSSYPIFLYAIKAMGMKFANPIIWVKNNTTLGWNDYRYKYEMLMKGKNKHKGKGKKKSIPILYGWNGGKHYFKDTRFESDVWEMKRRASQTMIHPTQKPIALISKAINNSTKRGEIVLDLFGGSGGTVISCEKLKRACRVNELDPIYCDVIIDRWSQYTGEKAVKII